MNLLRALVTVSGMTLLSRILGFVRDFVIARTFGAGLATDAFFVAFKLPNLLRRMFAEGAFSQAFVPILGEYKNKRGDQETLLLIDHVTSILALVLFAVTAIGVAAAPAAGLDFRPRLRGRRGQVRTDRHSSPASPSPTSSSCRWSRSPAASSTP